MLYAFTRPINGELIGIVSFGEIRSSACARTDLKSGSMKIGSCQTVSNDFGALSPTEFYKMRT